MLVDEWIALEMSSRKSLADRRIEELLTKIQPNDIIIASELSRLGRSIKETLHLIETIVTEKKARLVLIKQNLDLNPHEKNNMTNKILITVFCMVADLERDFISERTKEGLKAAKAKGKCLGKPKGTLQKSIYDADRERILELHMLGVSVTKIVSTHLGYGKYQSLRKFIYKMKCINNKD